MNTNEHGSGKPQRTCLRIGWALALGSALATPGWAFNSEEHKVMGDWAVSEIRLDRSIQLPFPTRFVTFPIADTHNGYRRAKELAIGTPFLGSYNNNLKPAQDHSYWRTYAQLEGNKAIWEIPQSMLRDNVLAVMGHAEASGRTFTFGELMSLYGDYRRTTYCSNGECTLTHAQTNTLGFAKGWDCFVAGVEVPDNTPFADCGYRPAAISMTVYLRDIASGLWPPYGGWGNWAFNTADNETDYHEAGWWGDEMMRIASTNDWHFGNGAIAWYTGMHRLALHFVELARTDPKYWNHVLHYEANALHSLTDLFAFGHVVTSRDQTSYGIMADILRQLTGTTTYQWMENTLKMGGGGREADGRISFIPGLPPIALAAQARNDFLPSYILGTGWAFRAENEHGFHGQFNGSGALVRNLRGDSLYIFGDAKLRFMTSEAREVLKEAIRVSVRSLFDAYVKLDRYGDTVAAIGAEGSEFFRALRYVPVFVESDPDNYFSGRWTRYADAIDTTTGSNRVPANWSGCQMPYIDGGSSLPTPSASACTTFPAVAANNAPSAPQLIAPSDSQGNVGQSATFQWAPSSDADGEAVTYDLQVCSDPAFPASCGVHYVIPSKTPNGPAVASLSGIGLLLFAATAFVGVHRRRRYPGIIALVGVIALSLMLLESCGGGGGGGGDASNPVVSFTVSGLTANTTYSWKVIADDGNGGATPSATRTFVTQ